MFILQFGKVTKARNSTKIPQLSGSTVEVLLKENTSVIRPIFQLRCGDKGMAQPEQLFEYNYCYVEKFKRYYYIKDIVSETAVVFNIHCEVDVLASFRGDILNTNAFIMYAQSKYNSSLNDERLPRSVLSDQHTRSTDIAEFDDTGCFALTIGSENSSGETGMAQTWIVGAQEMSNIASKLYSKDILDQLFKSMANPLDAIISCKWTALQWGRASVGSGDITIAGTTIGSGSYAKKVVEGQFNISGVYVKHQSEITLPSGAVQFSYGDYRNSEPYSQYFIYLPGVGLQQIPFSAILGGRTGLTPPQLHVKFAASPCTGDVTYTINRVNDAEQAGELGSCIMICSGNMGVDVPVSQSNSKFMSAIGKGAGAVGGAIMAAGAASPAAAIPGLLIAGGGIVGATVDSNSYQTSVTGALGGWSCYSDMYTKCHVITRCFDISDIPTRCLSTIGLPLFQTQKIGDMDGLIQCTGAHVKTWATEEEHDMIAQYTNSSRNYIYGGIIIE